MNSQSSITATDLRKHAGPHLGMLAIAYTILFNAGLTAVSAFGLPFGVKPPFWPGPWEPPDVIVSYWKSQDDNCKWIADDRGCCDLLLRWRTS